MKAPASSSYSASSSVMTPSLIFTQCFERHNGVVAKLRAISNLLGQREALEQGHVGTLQRSGAPSVTVATTSDQFTDITSQGAGGSEVVASSSHSMLAPTTSPLGVVGFFFTQTHTTATRSHAAGDVSMAGDIHFLLSDRLSALCGSTIHVLIDALRDDVVEYEATVVNGFKQVKCAEERLGGANASALSPESAQLLSNLLLQHKALMSTVAELIARDANHYHHHPRGGVGRGSEGVLTNQGEDWLNGQRYMLGEVGLKLRYLVDEWFARSDDGSYRLPQHLVARGAEIPFTILSDTLPSFVSATTPPASQQLSSPSFSVVAVPPSLLSETVSAVTDGITLGWHMAFASHPELLWEMGVVA